MFVVRGMKFINVRLHFFCQLHDHDRFIFLKEEKNLKGPDQMSANSTFHCALAVQKKDFCTFCLIAKAAYLTLGKEVD